MARPAKSSRANPEEPGQTCCWKGIFQEAWKNNFQDLMKGPKVPLVFLAIRTK